MENVFGFHNYKIVDYNNVMTMILVLTMIAMLCNYQQNVQLMVISELRHKYAKNMHYRLVVIWE